MPIGTTQVTKRCWKWGRSYMSEASQGLWMTSCYCGKILDPIILRKKGFGFFSQFKWGRNRGRNMIQLAMWQLQSGRKEKWVLVISLLLPFCLVWDPATEVVPPHYGWVFLLQVNLSQVSLKTHLQVCLLGDSKLSLLTIKMSHKGLLTSLFTEFSCFEELIFKNQVFSLKCLLKPGVGRWWHVPFIPALRR